MKGCRPLTDEEIARVLEHLSKGRQAARNRALFMLGLRTGFRISEILSLRLGAVYQNGEITHFAEVARRFMKNKRESRKLPLHETARIEIRVLVNELLKARLSDPQTFLFQSRNGVNRALNRKSAWEMLVKAYAACGLTGKLATHCMRKTFAKRMRKALNNDLMKLQKLMGHSDITATMKYLDVDDEELEAAVLK